MSHPRVDPATKVGNWPNERSMRIEERTRLARIAHKVELKIVIGRVAGQNGGVWALGGVGAAD